MFYGTPRGDVPLEWLSAIRSYWPKHIPAIVLINTLIPVGERWSREVDFALITPYGLHVVEFKNHKGLFWAPPNGPWTIKPPDGEPQEIYNQVGTRRESPVEQASKGRDALKRFLADEFQVGRHFPARAYVVLPHAQPVKTPRTAYRVDIIYGPTWLQDLWASICRYQAGFSSQPLLSPEALNQIVKILNVEPARLPSLPPVKLPPFEQAARSAVLKAPRPQSRKPRVVPSRPHPWRSATRKKVWAQIIAGVLFIFWVILLGSATGVMDVRQVRQRFQNLVLGNLSSTVPAVTVPHSKPTSTLTPRFRVPPSMLLNISPTPIPKMETQDTLLVFEKRGFRLVVTRLEIGPSYIRLYLKAENNTPDTIGLPVFKNAYLVDDLGNQYEANPFLSNWPFEIVPGAKVEGTLYFPRRLHSDAHKITLHFSTVYGTFRLRTIRLDIPLQERR